MDVSIGIRDCLCSRLPTVLFRSFVQSGQFFFHNDSKINSNRDRHYRNEKLPRKYSPDQIDDETTKFKESQVINQMHHEKNENAKLCV